MDYRKRRDFLVRRQKNILENMKDYILMNDWHGVADMAMDMREVKAEFDILEIVIENDNIDNPEK